jgi:hypothetical protein
VRKPNSCTHYNIMKNNLEVSAKVYIFAADKKSSQDDVGC